MWSVEGSSFVPYVSPMAIVHIIDTIICYEFTGEFLRSVAICGSSKYYVAFLSKKAQPITDLEVSRLEQ